MRPNEITPEAAAKWPEFVRMHSSGYPMPNFIREHEMSDEVYKDLIGGIRTREWKAGDGSCLFACPKGKKTWVKVDTDSAEVLAYIQVDERIPLINEPWFDLAEVISLAPSHWSSAMKSRYPGAIPSVVHPARY